MILTLSLMLAGCSGDKHEVGARFLIADRHMLLEVEGDERRVILEFVTGSQILDPSISPDGTKLAFALQAPAGNSGVADYGSDIYIAGRDGSNPQLVLKHAVSGEFLREPVWWQDGTLLFSVRGQDALGRRRVGVDMLILNSGARSRGHVIDNASRLDLGADRSTVVYVFEDPETGQEKIVLDTLPNRSPRPLLPDTPSLVLLTSPVLSSDGKAVAFGAADGPSAARSGRGTSNAHPTLQDIWLVNVDSSDLRRLAEIAESQPSIAWAKDGSAIYVLGAGGLRRIDAKTGAIEMLGEGVPYGQLRLLP